MSPRSLNTDFLASIESEQAEFVHLLEFSFSSGTVRLSTGAQDLSWDSATWEAVGGLLEFGGVEETNDSKGQGVDVKLSGVDQTVIAILLSANYRGRPMKIYRAHLDSALGTVVDEPLLLFEGLQLHPYTIEEDRTRSGGTVTIGTRIVGYLGLERIRGIQANTVSHGHLFTDDSFFQHTASLANKKVYWGTAAPSTLPASARHGGGMHPRQRGSWNG